jgi:hypothetical protein
MIPADVEIIELYPLDLLGQRFEGFWKIQRVAANQMVVRIGEPTRGWRVEGWAPLVSGGTTCSRSYGVPAGISAPCR